MNNLKNLVLKLNNFGFSPEVVDEVLEYKATWAISDSIKGEERYKKNWAPFYVTDGHLIYRPNNLKVIVDPEEKQRGLKEMYNDGRVGVGSGITQFYHLVCLKHLNIQRNDVNEFLHCQKGYQLSRNTRHVINKPVLASSPNERYCMYRIDLGRYANKNRDYRYFSFA